MKNEFLRKQKNVGQFFQRNPKCFFFQESVRNFFRKRFGWSASSWSIFKAFLVTMKIFC